MLGIFIIKELMSQEGRSNLVSGRLSGYSLSYIQKQYNIPKATFYREIKKLLDTGIVVKQRRNSYAMSNDFRRACNDMKVVGSVYV